MQSAAPSLPPGEPIALQNPSFTPDASGRLAGWTLLEHMTGNSYTFEPDSQVAVSPPASVRIRRHGREFYGVMDQRLRVQPAWLHRTVRLSGWLRAEGVTGTGGALILLVRDGSDQILVAEQMDGRRVRGTQDWQQYAVQIQLPPGSWWLQVGVMLQDDGTLWADDLALDLLP